MKNRVFKPNLKSNSEMDFNNGSFERKSACFKKGQPFPFGYVPRPDTYHDIWSLGNFFHEPHKKAKLCAYVSKAHISNFTNKDKPLSARLRSLLSTFVRNMYYLGFFEVSFKVCKQYKKHILHFIFTLKRKFCSRNSNLGRYEWFLVHYFLHKCIFNIMDHSFILFN